MNEILNIGKLYSLLDLNTIQKMDTFDEQDLVSYLAHVITSYENSKLRVELKRMEIELSNVKDKYLEISDVVSTYDSLSSRVETMTARFEEILRRPKVKPVDVNAVKVISTSDAPVVTKIPPSAPQLDTQQIYKLVEERFATLYSEKEKELLHTIDSLKTELNYFKDRVTESDLKVIECVEEIIEAVEEPEFDTSLKKVVVLSDEASDILADLMDI